MQPYPEFITQVLRGDHVLSGLVSVGPSNLEAVRRIETADDQTLFGPEPARGSGLPLVRGGLLYAANALDVAHRLFQDVSSDLGSYWHGMLHRREGDFDNARYWFRRAGMLPFFASLQRAASAISPDQAKQANWDPYLFTGQCEQARFGEEQFIDELLKLQRVEFDGIFGWTWKEATSARTAADHKG